MYCVFTVRHNEVVKGSVSPWHPAVGPRTASASSYYSLHSIQTRRLHWFIAACPWTATPALHLQFELDEWLICFFFLFQRQRLFALGKAKPVTEVKPACQGRPAGYRDNHISAWIPIRLRRFPLTGCRPSLVFSPFAVTTTKKRLNMNLNNLLRGYWMKEQLRWRRCCHNVTGVHRC